MLPHEGKLADLLGLLYEATTDDAAWSLFFERLRPQRAVNRQRSCSAIRI